MSTYTSEDKVAFIKSLYCPAKAVHAATGSSWELILAQAAGETGWGEKVLPGTNNIFNIKADSSWTGERKTFRVWERVNGKTVWVNDPFRVYPDIKAALTDRHAFLSSNPRYRKAGLFDEGVKGSLEKEARALQTAGYATDENYATGLVTIFRGATMQRAIREAEKQGCCAEPATTDWGFPFQDLAGKEIQDGGLYTGSPSLGVAALPKAADGFYPIGASGIWHGGIHFDAGTGTRLRQREGVRCIKDGEVVAYLVDSKYREIVFQPSGHKAIYSTGFTLVRHRIELPGAPPSNNAPVPAVRTGAPAKPGPPANVAPVPAVRTGAPAKPGPPAKPAPPPPTATPPAQSGAAVLTFYSLYIHQLDYEGYTEDPSRPRPAYWSEPKEYTVGAKAKDQQEAAELVEEPPEEPELLVDCSDFGCHSESD